MNRVPVASLEELQARGVVAVTKNQVAAAFQISVRTVTNMMKRGQIRYFMVGEKLVRFDLEHVRAKLRERGAGPAKVGGGR